MSDLIWEVTYETDEGVDTVEVLSRTRDGAYVFVWFEYKPLRIISVEEVR